jgi:D-methionine transport system substrate-binding protein
MKHFTLSLAAGLLSIGLLAGCGGAKTAPTAGVSKPADGSKIMTVRVGASPVPHAEILKFVKVLGAKDGLDVQIVEFTDYVKPNIALSDKELDANYFQHVPYLESFSAERKLNLVSAGAVHLEPLGLYSVKMADVSELKDGALITIPDDASNAGRALNLLASKGLIKLKDGVGVKATTKDITENPKKLNITMMAAEQLPRTLQDAAASVINTNYYLEAQKNLKLNAKVLARESAQNNPYANVVAVRKGDENRPEIQKLMSLLRSPEVKKFIDEKYQGAVTAAF